MHANKKTIKEIATEKIVGPRSHSRIADACTEGIRTCGICGAALHVGVGGPRRISAPTVKIKNRSRKLKF